MRKFLGGMDREVDWLDLPLAEQMSLEYDDVLLAPNAGTKEEPYAGTPLNSRANAIVTTQFGPYKNVLPFIMAPMEFAGENLARAYHAFAQKLTKETEELGNPMEINAVATIPRMDHEFDKQVAIARRLADDDIRCIHAIGFNGGEDPLTKAKKLVQAGVEVILLDTALGAMKKGLNWCYQIKHNPETEHVTLIAGNVVNHRQAKALEQHGVDILRVGIGGGSQCKTTNVTGFGACQLSAVMDTSTISLPVIADGGIREGGDIAKAFTAGASTVMIGKLFAEAEEAEGKIYREYRWFGPKYRIYRGQASAGYAKDRGISIGHHRPPEGKESKVYIKGTVEQIVSNWIANIRSSTSYAGGTTVEDLYKNTRFALRHSHPTVSRGYQQ